ncbi:MAG: HEAT repeat domain-containing protein [Thermoanaerobaculia bacterium]
MEKIESFLKSLGAFWAVVAAFPPGARAFYSVSGALFLVVAGMFIRQYSITSTNLTTSSATAALERKSLGGDPSAIVELSLTDSPRVVEVISTVLASSPRDDVRKVAAQALANVRDPAKITALGECLQREKWEVAAACAQGLGRSRDDRAIPYLVRALELNVDWLVAQKSAEALGFFPASPRVLSALVAALDIGSFPAEAAKQSLVNHGTPAVPYLVEFIATDHSLEALQLGTEALGLIGDPKAVGPLTDLRARVQDRREEQRWKDQLIAAIDQAIRRCRGPQ